MSYMPPEVLPHDEYNASLIANVHPPQWQNPEPAPIYNLVVIGAGPAGLVAAAGAAGLGAKVALVERHLIGGDCLNVGCVPSKCVIRSSRVAAELRDAAEFGISATDTAIDFAAVMARMRRIRAGISEHDSAERFRDLGIDVFLGEGSFSGPELVTVEGKRLRFKRAVIATGARAAEPTVPGIVEAGYLTNETVFNMTKLPERLAVYGAGPIGCELAQAFQRLGSKVTLIARSRLISRDDQRASSVLTAALMKDGMDVRLNTSLTRVTVRNGAKVLILAADEEESSVAVDEILVAVGRSPNVRGLGLGAAGVEHDERKGVHVDKCLRTTNPAVYAAGDVCMTHRFTHAADAAARIVLQNALFLSRKKLGPLLMPRCTYTDPEIAYVGYYDDPKRPVDTYEVELSDVDRALADGETDGFVKIHTDKGKDRIVGATIVAKHAGEMISEIAVAMSAGMGLGALANVIHPYPTQAEALKKAADAYNRTRLTPMVKAMLSKWLAWQLR